MFTKCSSPVHTAELGPTGSTPWSFPPLWLPLLPSLFLISKCLPFVSTIFLLLKFAAHNINLGFLYQGNHVIFNSPCLTSFTNYQGLKSHPASCSDITTFPLVTEDCYAPHFLHPSVCQLASGLLSALQSCMVVIVLQVSPQCHGALLSH